MYWCSSPNFQQFFGVGVQTTGMPYSLSKMARSVFHPILCSFLASCYLRTCCVQLPAAGVAFAHMEVIRSHIWLLWPLWDSVCLYTCEMRMCTIAYASVCVFLYVYVSMSVCVFVSAWGSSPQQFKVDSHWMSMRALLLYSPPAPLMLGFIGLTSWTSLFSLSTFLGCIGASLRAFRAVGLR